ncbi:phosphatidic acid phosphatase type 2/haloperoxidase [Scheffersomyces xylosifermentans]|uniref:phosphatidic acid phosphatase type 2/haloperoxidase n=1 Tax=Scheffersomyces xylosifermentans TaxID=1304137 RepID=UPI00315DCA73
MVFTTMKVYVTSPQFRRFLPDWITVIVLIVLFFNVTEVAQPFIRQFSISDPSISHPFATQERVTDNQLYVLSLFVPSITIILLSLVKKADKSNNSLANTTNNSFIERVHLIQVSNVGLWFGVCFAAVITDVLKCWIGNPRPDFLARCGPLKGTPENRLVGIEVCTAPLGTMYLLDGMKSTPSGHSSMAFAGLLYLTLWIIGQFKLLHGRKMVGYIIASCTPLVLASYIALSRTQDYRHHFFDVCFGSLLGIGIALVSYTKYFNPLRDEKSNVPIEYA